MSVCYVFRNFNYLDADVVIRSFVDDSSASVLCKGILKMGGSTHGKWSYKQPAVVLQEMSTEAGLFYVTSDRITSSTLFTLYM